MICTYLCFILVEGLPRQFYSTKWNKKNLIIKSDMSSIFSFSLMHVVLWIKIMKTTVLKINYHKLYSITIKLNNKTKDTFSLFNKLLINSKNKFTLLSPYTWPICTIASNRTTWKLIEHNTPSFLYILHIILLLQSITPPHYFCFPFSLSLLIVTIIKARAN